MNMEFQILNPLNFEQWDDLVLSTQDYSFFHSAAWAKVLNDSYQYQPHYFSLIENDKLAAVTPMMEIRSRLTGLRGVSLPFSDYCSPIIGEAIRFNDVFDSIVEYGKAMKWKTLEFRDGLHFNVEIPPSSFFYGHTLALDENTEKIFASLKSNTKRNIKKAIREGVTVKFSSSIDAVKEYYRLHSITRKKHGLPPQPFRFFKKIHDHVIAKNNGVVVLGFYQEKCIAGAVYFHFGAKAVYKFGASEMKFQELRANNLVMWEAIKWYAEQGYKAFCFGKTEPENEGLRQFKQSWGTTEQVIKYFKYDLVKDTFVRTKEKLTGFHNQIFGKMPISLLKLSGRLMYRHLG